MVPFQTVAETVARHPLSKLAAYDDQFVACDGVYEGSA
jgi:hypothetical protein